MTPARLAELRRQRDLLREHLSWMDREIAEAEGADRGVPIPVAVEPQQADALVTEATASLRAVEGFHPDPVHAARATRRGCLVALVIAFAVTLLTFTAIYYIGYSDRGLLSGSAETDEDAAPAPPPARPRR